MAIIRKSITGLKPGSDYLFSLKPKNVEISAADSEQETIRVSIPVFDGTPSIITGLQLASNFQTVIFKFDPINDADLSYFEYQLYDNEFGTGTPINPVTSTSNDPILISGTNVANVFLVSVENSTDTQTTQYWGRVRAVNIAGNPSTEWSDLIASGELDLISDGFIGSLTAAKITAGTIGSHTIVLNGANSILRSSTYNSTQGWQIDGQGNATFNTATLRGQLSSGTSPNWFRVDTLGNIWSGADTYANAANKFRVSNTGSLTANLGIIGGWTISSSGITSSNGLVTLSSNGNFSIGTSATNKATITSTGDFTVIGDGGGSYGIGTATFFGPWYQVKKGSDPFSTTVPFAQLTYKDFTFFTNSNGGYKVFIGGGNDGNNAFIDVGATGITDNNSISCSGWFRSSGTTGWYNQTYGGGIFMQDSTFVRIYNGKTFFVGHAVSSPNVRLDRSGYQSHVLGQGTYFMQLVNTDTFNGQYPGGIEVGSISIDSNGLGSGFNDVSDKRLKRNISSINDPINIIKNIEPVEYTMLDTSKRNHGFIAQDIYEYYPNIVTKGDDHESEISQVWSIDYSKMTPLLTAVVKELINKVEQLEQKVL